MEEKNLIVNRVANHEYYVLEKVEAGICLDGGEVKSLKEGSCNLKDSFCVSYNNAIYIKNMHVATYNKIGSFNTRDSRRDRKLLLHKSEILKITQKINKKGLTLVPLRVYLKQALIKIELGLCQGKHTYDKKQSLMEKDIKREQQRELKRS